MNPLNVIGFLIGGAMFLGGLVTRSAPWAIAGAMVAAGSLLLGAQGSTP